MERCDCAKFVFSISDQDCQKSGKQKDYEKKGGKIKKKINIFQYIK